MKRQLFVGLVTGALVSSVVFVAAAIAQGSGAGIAGSPHDFTDNVGLPELPADAGWNGREEVCRVCHVPHDHNRTSRYGDVGLLWNHAMSSQTYLMYSEDTHISFIDNASDTEPSGTTKMCLGCHDGTVGVDQFDKFAGGAIFIDDYNAGFQVPGAIFAGDLSSTHPLGVTYDPAVDTGLNDATTPMGTSGLTIGDVLDNGKVACMSCHDVHDSPGESVVGTHLLRANQKASTGTASELCLTCHDK